MWFEFGKRRSLLKELREICRKQAPLSGTVFVKLPGNMHFRFQTNDHGMNPRTHHVEAFVEDPKTGVVTSIWTNHGLFAPICKKNPFLEEWFYEAVEELREYIRNDYTSKKNEQQKLVERLKELRREFINKEEELYYED